MKISGDVFAQPSSFISRSRRGRLGFQLVVAIVGLLLVWNQPGRADQVILQMDIHQTGSTAGGNLGYYAFAFLNTTNTPVTYDQVYSANTNYQFQGGVGPGSTTYGLGFGSQDEMINAFTNGQWKLVMNVGAPSEQTYYFSMAAAGFTSNTFPVVQVLAPANGAANVTNNPAFAWTGTNNYPEVQVSESGVSLDFNNSTTLLPGATNWNPGQTLSEGKFNFSVTYFNSNAPTVLTITTPTNSLGQTPPGWVTSNRLFADDSSQFSVGIPDTSGTAHTLVAHYAWDGTNNDGTVSGADTSGNGYNINLTGTFGSQGGVSPTMDVEIGSGAVQFQNGDGNSGGHAGWNNPTPPALLSALAGSFSVSCWIKTTQNNFGWDQAPAYYGAGIVAADNYGSANDTVPLALTGNRIGFNTGGDTDDTVNSATSVNDGNYHHVVVTRNQQTGQKIIYIDGVLDSFGSGTKNLLNDPQKLMIGALGDASNPDPNDGSYFNGFAGEMDDLQFYSGVLSAGEVANLFANPGSTAANSNSFGGHRNVAHYTFDNSGNPGQDSSGNGNDMYGPTTWGPMYEPDTNAEAGDGAVRFFGTSALNASGQTLTNLNAVLAGSFTFSAWVKTTVTNGADYNNAFFGATIFWAYNDHGNTNDTIPLSITGSKAAFTTRDHLGNNNTLHSTTSVNDGNYHLITVTRDQATGEKKIYVDGNFETSEIGTTDPLNGDNYTLTIGGYAYCTDGNCTNYYAYNGLLDDVQIYSGVLSAAEVASQYANPGTTVPDVAGSSDIFASALGTSGLNWITGGDLPWFVETTTTLDGQAAQSGPVTNSQSSYLETTVPTDGQVSFNWKVSSEDGYDYLTFYINGNEQDAISGEVDWNQENYAVSAGDTLRWEYSKDDSSSAGLDAGFLDQVNYTPNNSQNFNTALGTANWNWSVSGAGHWFTETTNTHDGYFAAQSGSVSSNQTSVLQTTVTGPGTLGFWWTTLFNYEDYYNSNGIKLQFSLDGNDFRDISGYGGYWTQESGIIIPPGQHTLAWTAYGQGSLIDAGFLDQVVFTDTVAPQITGGPYGTSVQTGSNIVLTVQLYANPPAVIAWLTNGVAIPGATNATLVISNAQLSNTGYYQVVASNYLGTASSSAYVSVYQPTDLQPLSLAAPSVVGSTTFVPLVWTATNTGPATVSGYDDTIYIKTNGAIVGSYSYYIGYFGMKVLPGTAYTISNLFQFPSLPAGNYTLTLSVDSYNNVIETDESNNTLLPALPVTVINPDLQPGNLQISSVTNLGHSVLQFTYNTTNNGPGILNGAAYYDELFISTNSVLDASAQYVQQINQSPTLGVGQYFTSTNYATIPVVSSGNYYLILHVDNFGPQPQGYIWETSESNNYAVLPIHILEPDLVPTNIIAPPLASSREPLQIGWNILNQGDGIATNLTPYYNNSEWTDGLYLSTNQQVNAASILIGNYSGYDFSGHSYYYGSYFPWNAPLAPGQAMTNLQSVILPNVPAGNYYLVITSDINNTIREINEANNVYAQPITLGTLDLAPTAFSIPAAANTRSTISATWAVTNQGTGTVYPSWADRIFISTNAFLDSSATLLGEFAQTNPVAAGSFYTATNAVTLNGVGAGNYYLLLDVDAGTNVMETSRSNNVVALPLAINSPDLVATALTVGTNFSSQQPFSAVYSVSNASPVTAYVGWSDELFLSPDGIIESNNLPFIFGYEYYSGAAVIDVVQGSDLAAHTGYSQLVNSSIPAVPAGDYFVLLQANANNFFAENNPQNNLLAKPVHINNPDLVLTNFAAPTSIVVTQYSQSFEADWSVQNQGAGDAYVGWSDYLYLSRTNVLDTNAVYIGSTSQNPVLSSGQSYLSFASVNLPDGIQGNYYLILRANDSHSLYEATYTNNLVVRPVNLIVPPVPVLSVTSVDSPADAWSGQQVYVTWTLTNSGPAAVSGTFNDVVYLCGSATGASPQAYGQFQFTGQILPGQAVVRQQKIYLPINLQGTFWVALQTDANHNVFEFTGRTNDFLVANHPLVVHLTPTPNLQITSVGAPTNMYSGGEGTVSWVETNSGSGPTSAPFWDDAVYLCDTTNYYTANYRVFLGAPNNVAYLNPGDSYASSAHITLPRGITGTFYFVVWADAGNNVFEGTNENDNLLTSAPVFVQPSTVPDLQVTTVQPPHDAFSGQSVSFKYAVTNFGLGQTQPSEVQWSDRVYISTNATLDSSATYLGDVIHNGGLTPSAGYAATSSLTLPVGITGDWYFIVSADIFNQVYEAAFEDNNSTVAAYVTHIALTPPPDLVTTILQAPTNALTSHLLNVTYAVANNGTTITPNSGWNDTLYLWTNSVFDAAHALYLTTATHYGALSPGAGYTNTLSVVLPSDMTGTNYIFVQGDAYNVVFELNKTNNLAVATNPVVISFLPSDLAVTSLTAPTSCNAGAGILVNWAVTNLGAGDTAVAIWNDRLVLSQNILPGAPSDITLVQVQHNGLVSANGSYTVANQLAQIPTSVAAGNYQLFLIADAGSNVPVETNRNNNVYGPIPITITAHSPDLRVISATGPTNAVSGSTITVNWTVTNAGDLPANSSYWYDTVYLSPDGLLGPDAIPLGYQQNVRSLLPGESYTSFLSAALPVNVQSNYYFVVVADGYNYIPEAGAENNNSYVVTPPVFITLSPVPDLAVTDVITPANAFEGQNFHLSWVVKNVGTATASSAWYDVAYLSADQILDPNSDTYLGYAYQSHDLAPGQSYTNSADFPIPQGLTGPFYVFVTTDPGHAINERGQLANNTAYNPQAMLVQLLPPVDLVAGSLTIPVNAVPGQNMTVSYTVQNQGSNTALGSWVDSLFISADTNWDVGDTLFARVTHTGDVPPGGAYTGTVTAALPGVLPGDYHVIIRSDILNHLTEANKSNNIAASLDSTAIDVQSLTFGTPAGGTIGTGQSAFYKFDVTNGQTIHLQFSSEATLSDNELFVKFGQMPTSGSFDFAANDPFVANPDIYLTATNTGTYYVLVKCNYALTPTPYTVLAEVLPFTVTEIQPSFAGDAGSTTFLVRGALFDGSTQFILSNNGTNASGGTNSISARSVSLDDSSTAYVTFDLAGAQDGYWNIQAVNGQTNSITVTLSNAVMVAAYAGPVVDVVVDGPLAVSEPSFGYVTHSCLVDYGNSGYSDVAPPLILVDGVDTTIGTTPYTLGTKTIQLLGRSLTGPANILRPLTYASKILYFRGEGTEMTARGVAADSIEPLTDSDWTNIEASLRPTGIADANWLAFWSNIRPRVGTTWGDYVKFLDRLAQNFPAEQREVGAMIASIYTNQPGFQASSIVSGVLLGSTNGQPLAGVEVGLMPLDTNDTSPFGGTVFTDQNGRFLFPNVAPGQYACTVAGTPYDEFDMDLDGQADSSPPVFTVTSQTDLVNQVVYLFQPQPLVLPTNDADATLTLDSKGVLHAFWHHEDRLWHAWNNNGNWVDAGPISTNYVTGFAAGAGAQLVDGLSPGLIVVWSEEGTNSSDLFYSVGQSRTNGGFVWSQPTQLTHDPIQNYSPSVTVRNNGMALITYLKRGIGIHDDSDVYFSAVNVASGNLLWNGPSAQVSDQYFVTGNASAGTSTKIVIGYGFNKNFSAFGNVFQLAAALDGEAEAVGCSGTGTVKASGGLNFNTENWKGGIFGSGDMSLKWDVDPEQCAWKYNGEASVANLHFGGTLEAKNAVFTMLKAYPPTFSFAAATEDFMNDFAKWANVDLQNSIGFGVQVNMNGCHWTQPPINTFGIPTVDSSDCEIKGFIKFGVTAKAGRSDMDINLNAQPQTFTADAGGNGLSSSLELVLKFGLKPDFKPLTLTASGTVTFELWGFHPTLPAPSLVITFGANGVPTQNFVRPKSDSTTLPGWTFVYDPASSVGTTSVYGTNAVLSTVATDTANDGAPSLALDGSGVPYQVWFKDGDPFATSMGSQIYVADYNGTSWNAPVVIPNTLGFNSYVSAATDRLGQRLAVWVHADASSITTNATADEFFAARNAADVYFSTFNGSAWSTPQLVSPTAGPDSDLQLSCLTNGNVLAVWTYTDSSSLKHLMASYWNGGNWTAPDEITSGQISSPTAQQIAGATYLLWTQTDVTNHDRAILQSQNVDGYWSKPEVFAPTLLSGAPSLTAAIQPLAIHPKSVFDFAIDASCCKCKNNITSADPTGVNVHCGVAQNGFDYVHCKKLFVYKACQVRPSDPNNIVGPEGYGPGRWVPSGSSLGYTIQFENDPALASAPAKRVTITLPLDANFDPRTFRLGDFGFGGLIFNIPAGSAFYQTRLDLSASKGYYVDLIAGVDIVNRQAFWTLTTIDPATGDVPQNALIGFLPPDNNPPEGEGYVTCTIIPLAGVTNGTPVAAKATIVFDNQPPMDTPYTLNTLQTGQPSSSVLPLPAVTLNPTFDVAWQGVVTSGGSGVSSYDIYASNNGGNYYQWLQGTTLSHAPFVGQPGNTYAFYSIAHDNVGNIQPAPTNADAVTFISSNLPPVIGPITNVVVAPNNPVLVRVKATDPNGDKLTYSLVSGPAGSIIGPTNGYFRWLPSRAFAATTNYVTVAVVDNGVPPLGTNQTFAIIVQDFLELTLGETNLQGGQTASIPVSLASNQGATNLLFTVQVPENLLTNWTLAATAPQIGTATLQDFVTNILITLNATPGQSLQGTQQISTLAFSAVTNRVSGFITLPITSINAVKPDGTAYANYITHAGTVIVVQNEPLLRASVAPDQSRTLQLYGKLGTDYQLLFSTNLAQPSGWQPLLDYTQTNGVINLPLDTTNPVIFYRLLQQ